MKCKINRHASKVLKEMMASEEGTGKLIRVYVTHMHGDHAHYDLRLILQLNTMKLLKQIKILIFYSIREKNI